MPPTTDRQLGLINAITAVSGVMGSVIFMSLLMTLGLYATHGHL